MEVSRRCPLSFFLSDPQRLNLSAHLETVRRDIEAAIPREAFDGLAIIDFEEWRPVWKLNWGDKKVYLEESVRWVKQRFPNISRKSAVRRARREFNEAAK